MLKRIQWDAMLSDTQRAAAIKRIADVGEKFAIVSAALGVYEGSTGAMLVAGACTVRGAK